MPAGDDVRRADVETRREWFRSLVFQHPRMVAVRDQVLASLEAASPTHVVAVCGPTGVGKTTLMRSIERTLRRQCASRSGDEDSSGAMPVVALECPSSRERSYDFNREHWIRLLVAMGDLFVGRPFGPDAAAKRRREGRDLAPLASRRRRHGAGGGSVELCRPTRRRPCRAHPPARSRALSSLPRLPAPRRVAGSPRRVAERYGSNRPRRCGRPRRADPSASSRSAAMRVLCDLLPPGRVLSLRRRWCPLCYREMRRRQGECWDPLLRSLGRVVWFPLHRRPLCDLCRHCGRA